MPRHADRPDALAAAKFEENAMLIISFLAILVLLVLLAGVRIANQYERAVIFRLGKYARTSGPGLYLLIPVHRVAMDDRHAHDDDRGRAAGGDHQGQCAGQNQRGDLAQDDRSQTRRHRGRRCRQFGRPGRRNRAAQCHRPAYARRRAEGAGGDIERPCRTRSTP